MERIKNIKDYMMNKTILKNRHILYEDIIPEISDELGFKYFSSLFNIDRKSLVISKEVQINYFLNNFLDIYGFYDTEARNVFYEMARIIYSVDKNEKWEENEGNRYPDDFEDVEERLSDFMNEFDEWVKEKNKNFLFEKVREPLESGHTIALAFYMIDKGIIPKDYLPYFCSALDEFIVFVGHTEFYTTEVGDWLQKVFGRNERPVNFELP